MTGITAESTAYKPMREKDVFCVKKRFCCVLLSLALIIAMMSFAAAEVGGVTISSIYQDEGNLGVLTNLTDTNGNDIVDNLSAESHYLIAEIGEQKIPTQAFLVENSKFQKVSYIILVDATMKYQDALAAKQALISFCGSLNNEEMYVIHYHEEIANEFNNFVDDAKDLTGKNKLIYKNQTKNKPNMVGAINYALNNVINKAAKDSQKVFVIITDQDADSYEDSFLNQISIYLPIYFVSIGGQRNIIEQYAAKTGGQVFQGSGNADTITQKLLQIKSNIRTKALVWFAPIYEVFTVQGELGMNMEVAAGDGKSVKSNTLRKALTAEGVPTPTPDPATPEPTPTPTPAPTMPPTATPSPTPTPTPTATPEPTPTPTPTPVVTDTPEPPTPTPTVTIPPEDTPTPVITEEPTKEPEEKGGSAGFITDTFGPNGGLIAGLIALLILAVVVLLIVFIRSRKKNTPPPLKMESLNYPGSGDGAAAKADKAGGGYDGEATTYGNDSRMSDGEKTAYGNVSRPDDGEKTTFGNPLGGSYNAMGGFDGESTTSPFSQPSKDPFQQSMFGSAETNVPETPDEPAGDDFGDETLPMTHFDDEDKTAPIRKEPELKIRFRIETDGNASEKTVSIRDRIVLGRGADCDVQVNDKSVSKHHVEISLQPDGLYLKDLGSSNGTKVNGTSVTGPVSLRTGDALELGYSKVTIEIQL